LILSVFVALRKLSSDISLESVDVDEVEYPDEHDLVPAIPPRSSLTRVGSGTSRGSVRMDRGRGQHGSGKGYYNMAFRANERRVIHLDDLWAYVQFMQHSPNAFAAEHAVSIDEDEDEAEEENEMNVQEEDRKG
jgi:hypothetical protein